MSYHNHHMDRYLVPDQDSYYSNVDNKFGGSSATPDPAPMQGGDPKLEEPIMSADELGVTIVDRDPQGRNLLQTTQAAIRQGASQLQLVMSSSNDQPIGGGFKSIGKDIRKAVKEATAAAGVTINGVEVQPSAVNNLSGFDGQRGNLLEEKRQRNMAQIKEAINFAAEVTEGGGVDYWSQEFARNIFDAEWNKKGKWANKFEAHQGESDRAVHYLVDDRTGNLINAVQESTVIYEPVWETNDKGEYLDAEGEVIEFPKKESYNGDDAGYKKALSEALLARKPEFDNKTSTFKTRALNWEEVKKRRDEYNKAFNTDFSPEEWALRIQYENKVSQSRGQSLFYTQRYQAELDELDALKDLLKQEEKREEHLTSIGAEDMINYQKDNLHQGGSQLLHGLLQDASPYLKPSEVIKKRIDQIKHSLKHTHEASSAADVQAAQVLEDMEHIKKLSDYAYDKSVLGLSELALYAKNETDKNKDVKNPIYVGPELGWPTSFGGHPEEFIKYIKDARKQMAKQIKHQYLVDREGDPILDADGKKQKNPYFNPNVSQREAEKIAKQHVKGMFDTGHMGMWLEHFKKEGNETEQQRQKRFNKWYLEMTNRLAEEDVVGGIQAVDTATGPHAHLPPGQGILPIRDSVKILKQKGFDGFVVSEGHEEEAVAPGRILYETWKHFGAHTSSAPYSIGPGAGAPPTWNAMNNAHAGYSAPPFYIVGAYSPSNEWKLWSDVPFE